jgi:CBS domain-containing protein
MEGKDYKVRDLMRPTIVVRENDTLRDALEALVDGHCNVACVVDENGVLVGGFSTVDIIRAILPDYFEEDMVASRFADDSMLQEDVKRAATMPIRDFLYHEHVTIKGDATLLEATAVASAEGHSRIIVVDDENKPIGIVTRTEIKQVLANYLGIKNELKEACTTCGRPAAEE